ncbi:MAG: AAA family ATPase [Oscillospiraceae bacterium]|nr:AAA family ATPase [Oscillospiraceae bacterium]
MRIYSMTATFGKLENQTLTFEPGLNVIHAPNEWGKSTWCAFLVNMLYGLETRAKTTKTALADKERYAPWSGAAMAGRIDLNWNSRDITIERWTKGRTPMGEFRAYETESGISVPELTGANCGQQLLGVERSVFLRAGFLRLSDLPVTQDESLRRRLNALVTTGDESDAGDLLAQKLKDLKNKVRYNRSGLLPQAELARSELTKKLQDLQDLQRQSESIRVRQGELEAHIARLENHRLALQYEAAEENRQRIAGAEAACQLSQRQLEELEARCANLPPREEAEQKYRDLQQLHQQQLTMQMEVQMLPQQPEAPNAPLPFYSLDGRKAIDQANTDIADFCALTAPVKKPFPLWIPGALAILAGIVLAVLKMWIPGGCVAAVGAVAVVIHFLMAGKARAEQARRYEKAEAIRSRYGGGEPQDWLAQAHLYADQLQTYDAAMAQYRDERQQTEQRLGALNSEIRRAAGSEPLPIAMEKWKAVMESCDALLTARREHQHTLSHAEALKALAQPVQKPEFADELVCSKEETEAKLQNARFELRQRQTQLDQCIGQMKRMESEAVLLARLEKLDGRISRLNDTYAALELAQSKLAEASAELQRRFAPRIAKQAQALFARLTGGRYERLTLSEDLSVNAGAQDETTLHTAAWRSEGTADQLYLALRLAVAAELTPEAPLILDDALVRFDDTRHASAMEILREEADNKQILLFTCQKRELEA